MKNKKEKSDLKKADQLIEEALINMEHRESAASKKSAPKNENESDEIQIRAPDANRDSGAFAKIDPKQFIEKEAYLRLAADFENFRKRASKERSDAERSGREKILRGFLEILDNLERGLSQAKEDQSALADGIRIILSQVETWLKTEGLERIETIDKPFDPTVHDAISQIESDLPAGMVVEEVKRGYKWTSRLLRPATVVVSRGRPEISIEDGQ